MKYSHIWVILGILLLSTSTLASISRRTPHGPFPVYRPSEVDPFPRRLQGMYGDAHCPCIDPWEALGGIPRNISFVEPKTSVGCIKYFPDSVATPICYPLDYGSSTCNAWDRNLAPWCADATGRPLQSAPAYCNGRWCWVNKSNCDLDPDPSNYFPGFDLHFSYETCGSVDNFAIELLTKSLKGRVLKVGLPGTEPPFIDVRDDPAAPNGVRVGGITHDFLQALAEVGGFKLEFHKFTKDSHAVFPKSTYSACVRDVALHRVDFCAGVFYETPERRSMATFTPSYFPDLHSLIVFTKGKLGPFEMLGKVFAPFSPILWLVIAGLAWGVGFAMWIFGEVPDTPPVSGTMIGMRQAAMKFLGQGKDRDAKTKGGQIVLLGFSFMCMLGAASYTANLSSFLLMSNLDTGIKDIYDAIEQKKKVCALEPLKGLMLGRYPEAEKIMIWVSWFDEAMMKMDAGECDGMLLNENEYARMFGNIDFWGDTGNIHQHCSKTRVGDIVLSVPLGFPIRREIEQAVGYLMVKAQADGVLEEIMKEYPPPDPECDAIDGLKAHAMALEPSDLIGVIILTLVTLGLGFFAHHLERRAHRAHKELTKKGGLVRKSRFEKVKKRFSGDTNESGESLTDADNAVDESNCKEVHGASDDMPKQPKRFGRFDEARMDDELSSKDNCNSDNEGHHEQSQDMGQLGREVSIIGRQVGLLTEVVSRLREDVAAVRQHLDMNNVDTGNKLVDRDKDRDEYSTGAVSLVSAWTPIKQAECLSACSSNVEQPPGTNWDGPWSERARERPPNMHGGGGVTKVQVNL